ncbi:MAG: type II secretion system protein N [Gammaproteobacteria bacterium]|nr:type II secretion system protein N [Gammaproteobacteria bacterium]
MAKRSLYVAAGIAAFLGFMVAMVPASQLARRLPAGMALDGVSGTVWSGRARALAVQGRTFGALRWSCGPWRLVLLEWSCTLSLQPQGGQLAGEFTGDFAGDMVGRGIRGSVPIGLFEGVATPRGWTGSLELDLEELAIAARRPQSASGTLFLRGLRAPGAHGQYLGDFELVVGEGSVGGATLNGRLRDLGGPLRVRGAVELFEDGRYLIQGEAAPGPGAGPAIFDTLGFLGPPDNQGRCPFTIEGTL